MTSYYPLVHKIANSYAPLLASFHSTPLTVEDLIQEGYLGLITAINRQKQPAIYIRKFILEAIRRYANIVSRPCHNHEDIITLSFDKELYREEDDAITLADTLPDTDSGQVATTEDDYITPLSILESREQAEQIIQSFSKLSIREQAILTDLYGFNPGQPNRLLKQPRLTIAQTAAKYNLSECNIRQIHSRACHKLRLLP